MPDFEKLLRQRLGSWNCPGRSEVIRELAAHLEDRFQELVRKGMAPDKAVQAAFEIVGDWRELRTQIAAARRRTLTERASCILIPGAIALLMAAVAEKLLWPIYAGAPFVDRNHSWFSTHWAMLWVTVVAPRLFAGAAGAAVSLYAGGSRGQRIWAAEIPALPPLALFFVAFARGIAVETLSKHGVAWQAMAASASRNLLFIILIPAGALLAGALPFLVGRANRNSENQSGART